MSDERVLALDADLYPDIAAQGGVGPAWRNAARQADLDLDGITWSGYGRLWNALVETPRGTVDLHLGAEYRVFSMLILVDGREWVWGSTDDLTQTARVAVAWRDGSTVREMIAAFPFLKTDRIAQAREDGNLREVLWSIHLEDPGYATMRPVLQAAHDDPRLSRLFPSVTHQTLARFTVDDRDRTAGQIAITYFPDHYEVESSWHETARSATTPTEAVRLAAAHLPNQP